MDQELTRGESIGLTFGTVENDVKLSVKILTLQ